MKVRERSPRKQATRLASKIRRFQKDPRVEILTSTDPSNVPVVTFKGKRTPPKGFIDQGGA